MTTLKHLLLIGLWLVLMTPLRGAAQDAARNELPMSVSDADWEPLREQVDPLLQSQLEARLARNKTWRTLIQNRKMAVAVVDLSVPGAARFARVNGNVMMYAASLPKLAILLGAAQALEDGLLVETPEVLEDMNAMIRFSNNAAATRMYERVGFEKIKSVLMDPRYALFDTTYGGGLWVGKPYGDGPRHGDPLHNLSHGATVSQVSRFYYLLATGRLVNRARSRQMLDILSNPSYPGPEGHALSQIGDMA